MTELKQLMLKNAAPICFSGNSCRNFECQDGWFPIVFDMATELEALQVPGKPIVIWGFKEKMGTLRVFVDGGGEEVFDIVRRAESKSATTCEDCGGIGAKVSDGWIRTLCQSCNEAWAKKRGRAEPAAPFTFPPSLGRFEDAS